MLKTNYKGLFGVVAATILLMFGCDKYEKEVELLPHIDVSSTDLDFGKVTTRLTFNLINDGGTEVTWTATSDADWLSFDFSTGTILTNDSVLIVVNVNRSGLWPGRYSGILVVQSDGGVHNISVTMDVTYGIDKIVYSSERHDVASAIYTMNFDGSDQKLIAADAHSPRLSSDGKQIVFARRAQTGKINICKMSIDGSSVTPLTSGETDAHPSWSFDGKKITFIRRVADPGIYEIFTMNSDGTDVVQVTNTRGSAYYPVFSPDGSKILFQLTDADEYDFEIAIMNTDGSNMKVLTENDFHDRAPDFSADGSSIAFGSTRGNVSQIFTMNADGSGVQQITTIGGTNPRFGEFGSVVFTSTGLDTSSEVFVVDQTGNVVQLTDNSFANAFGDW